jgi:hypothetical protein
MPWVHAVIDVPSHLHEATSQFWGSVLGWRAGAPWPDHPELRSFEPAGGAAYLHLQRVEGSPRVHLDLEAEDPDATVGQALEHGAVRAGGQDRWQSLLSPGGLPFCVLGAAQHTAPDAVTWPGGHRSRMVQVCIDAPATAFEHEVRFWRRLLPGRWAPSDSPEFAGKWHDDAGAPLQLLFQRLGDDEGPVRAHLDHGTDALRDEVLRVLNLGAEDVGPGRGWHVLRDPAGLSFCVTENSPQQTAHRDIG